MRLIVFLLAAIGLYTLWTALLPGVYAPAAAVLQRHAPKKITRSEVVISRISEKLLPIIDLDPIRKTRLSDELRSLGRAESPEQFEARALAGAIFLSLAFTPLILVTPMFLAAILIICWAVYSSQEKKLKKELDLRKRRIERELPQFAGTVRQCLNSTHDVVAILDSYRKVCGESLRIEIDRTLNEMKTGNSERAVKHLESRIGSAEFSQLTRGLIGVMRGDDQRIYFDMLTAQYRKAQDEAVKQELRGRPSQLNPYVAMLFGCIALMLGCALGLYLKELIGAFF